MSFILLSFHISVLLSMHSSPFAFSSVSKMMFNSSNKDMVKMNCLRNKESFHAFNGDSNTSLSHFHMIKSDQGQRMMYWYPQKSQRINLSNFFFIFNFCTIEILIDVLPLFLMSFCLSIHLSVQLCTVHIYMEKHWKF